MQASLLWLLRQLNIKFQSLTTHSSKSPFVMTEVQLLGLMHGRENSRYVNNSQIKF